MSIPLYRGVFDLAPDGLLVVDDQGQIVLGNARAEQLFGYQHGELTHRPVEILIPQRFTSAHAGHRQRYLSEPRIRPMGAGLELYGIRKDGSEFPVDLMLGPLDTDQGLFVVAVVRDESERRTAELERQRIVALANEHVEFIGMCDQEFRPFYVNAAGMRLVGLESLEAACKARMQDYFFPEDQPFITSEFFPQVVRDGRAEVEIRFRHFQTGVPLWMLCTVFNLRDAKGAIIGWATVSRNIDERKRAEESLRTSEERFRLAQQAARIGTFEWNVQTGLNTWTPELETMYGLQPGTFRGTQQAWEDLVHPADRAAALSFVERAFATDKPVEGQWRVVWPDGSLHWIVGRFQLLRDAGGRPSRLIGANIDITSRRLAEEELQRSRDELERRVEERTRELRASVQEKEVLLRELHHRVKNNLAIISSLFALQLTNATDPQVARALRESEDRVRAMVLVHEALFASNDIDALEFSEYARTVTQHLFKTYGAARRIELVTDLRPVTLSVDAAIPWGLILTELVSNALKHAFPNARDGRIVVAIARREDGQLVLRVADNGVGMATNITSDTPSLGLRLIRSLASQIGAAFELRDAAPGVEALIACPAPASSRS